MLAFPLGKVLHNYLKKLLYSHIGSITNAILSAKFVTVTQPIHF